MSREIDEHIAAIKSLHDHVTPGRWLVAADGNDLPKALTVDMRNSLLGLDRDGMAVVARAQDAAFIAIAVNAAVPLVREIARLRSAQTFVLYPFDDWHEDNGIAFWWKLPVAEPPYVGTPFDTDWIDGYFTHWSRLPSNAEIEAAERAAGVKRV